MDEAAEMLSLQAGLTGITDDEKMGKTIEAQKRKEAERSEKWRKMATAVKNTAPSKDAQPQPLPLPDTQIPHGQGMSYTFDTASPKLIDRTWKGIPDCWRSAAWYSFLVTSAKAHNSPETDDYLIAEFRRLQAVASPDDVQIDLDVPRTVNGHIMFRRRYRGGQRLLFRVLHAISLYFPGTGYVQGMASLVATLLCYYDEERAFVMLVRLWRYRGLESLYQPGFGGLMNALSEFEKRWLAGAGKDIAAKLVCPFSLLPPTSMTNFLRAERPRHRRHRLRNPLVPYPLQPLHPLPRPAARMGRLYAPGRLPAGTDAVAPVRHRLVPGYGGNRHRNCHSDES
jgi:hypothetical protein